MARSALVTGGAGFVGSHLCERLLQNQWHVTALDDYSTGDRRHATALLQQPNFRMVEHDIVQPLPQDLGHFDRIFNLACPASPPRYQEKPVQTTLTSVVGIWQLLELAQRTGARLLHASTSEVYGDPDVHPQPESYFGNVNPIGIRACYDEGKRCAEALAFSYLRERGVDIRVARIFNSYGPRLKPGDGRVVSNFVVQALQGEPLTVYGEGRQTRSFCFVDDTVEGLLRLMESDLVGPVNIGNPREHTVLELAEMILGLTGSASTLVNRPLPADDPRRRCPDISLARERLRWEPEVSLDSGLRRTIDYFAGELERQ